MSHRKIAARCSRGLFVAKPVAVLVAAVFSSSAFAQSAHTELAPVVVTANPLGSGLFDMVTPVTVVNRREISDRSASTLGEALEATPGPYFLSSFGLVDITFAPFLERIVSSLLYYKGFAVRGEVSRWGWMAGAGLVEMAGWGWVAGRPGVSGPSGREKAQGNFP